MRPRRTLDGGGRVVVPLPAWVRVVAATEEASAFDCWCDRCDKGEGISAQLCKAEAESMLGRFAAFHGACADPAARREAVERIMKQADLKRRIRGMAGGGRND